MNISDPILTFSQDCKLKNGTEVKVKGEVFNHPIMPRGEPQVHNMVRMLSKEGKVMGIAFYPVQMGPDELAEKVGEWCEDPDQYLGPLYKQKFEN